MGSSTQKGINKKITFCKLQQFKHMEIHSRCLQCTVNEHKSFFAVCASEFFSVWQTLTDPSVAIYFWAQSHRLTFSLNLLRSPLGFLLLFLFLLQAHSKLEWHSRNCQNSLVFEDEYFTAWSFWKAQPANRVFFLLTIWSSWSERLVMKLDHGGNKGSKDTV